MSEAQHNDISGGTNIEVFDNINFPLASCYIVAYALKEKKGRLALRENIALQFDEPGLKILITGLSIGQGNKYQIIHGIVFDQDQEFTNDRQITFTFNKVSDWSSTIGFSNE